jgi:protein involved in ribonucleotide reduction
MSIKICYFHVVFSENAKELSNKYNWPIETEFNPKSNDIYILFGSNEIPQILLKQQEELPFKIFYIILNSEQIESRFLRDQNYIKLLKTNFVLSYSNDITRWLEKNINIKVLGNFYFPFPESNFTSFENREIDVAFVGTVTARRHEIIENLKKTSLNVYVDFEWKYKIPEELTKLLNKCKVVINIPYYDKNSLETHRIIKALSCGCKVISLRSSDDDLDAMFEDYIYFTSNIIKGVSKYFNNELKPKKTFKELIKFLDSKIDDQYKNSIDTVIKLTT